MLEMVKFRGALRGPLHSVIFSVLWALMASAILVESDIYRYVTIIFVIFVLISYRTALRKISYDWLAILCYAWAAYAIIRFLVGVLVFGERGTSEWLYIFPVFFPFIGLAISVSQRYIFSAATILISSGLASLILTLNFPLLFMGKRAAPLFHHNPIHAGVGSCMLFLTSVFWLLHAAESGRLSGSRRWFFLALGTITAILSLIGVLGSQSKGAWLALVATLAFIGLLILLHYSGRWRLHLMAGLVLVVLAATAIATSYVTRVAGATVDAATELITDALITKDLSASAQRLIVDPAIPRPVRERLELWTNAIELFQASPWVGWGNLWLREWRKTTYSDVGFNLIHNGYLEIMVRHGLLGIAFLLVFAVAGAHRVNNAHRLGVISSSLAVYLFSISFFFFCTIATNSNNRLAIGESFFIIVAAAIFSITILEEK